MKYNTLKPSRIKHMKNPFIEATHELIKDLENYDFLNWDLEINQFLEHWYAKYINDKTFWKKYPDTLQILLFVALLSYQTQKHYINIKIT